MQTIYINQLLNTHQMSNCNFSSILIVKSTNLAFASNDYLPDAKDVSAYKRFTRNIQWLACKTHFDIISTVSKLSHHNIKPINQWWNIVMHLLRYLKRTWTCGIHYSNGDLNFYGYSDSL